MKNMISHLWLGVSLIIAASLILLLSDLKQHRSSEKSEVYYYPAIAIMQHASTQVLDSHVDGVVSRLDERGYRAPDGSNIRLYNAQGDYATASAIANEIVTGPYDLVITSSTISLQSLSKANANSRKKHVFGAVTDPYGTGVGISGPEPDQHPAYMAGIGTFQPVEHAFRLAHEMNPELKRVGVVWNPGEQCSEACLKLGRSVCADLGLDLIEANASNPSEVVEALYSILSKDIDAIWIGGDTVAMAAVDLIVRLATEKEIAVFSNGPLDVERGVLFGLGADYFQVGEYTAELAADILDGTEPSSIRIENVIPEQLQVNRDVLARLARNWALTPAIQQRLTLQQKQETEKELVPEPGKTYRIALSYIVPAPIFDIALKGFRDGLQELGFIEGKNLQLTTQHANGDMSFLPQVTNNLVQNNPDILVAMSTPSLGSAIAHADGVDIAFGIVSAPLEAGAGESFDDHLPQVTGIAQQLPTQELFDWVGQIFPQARTIGALYNPSEANAAKEIVDLQRILDKCGIALEKTAVYTTSEVPEGIRSLLTRNVDLVFVMGDNTVANGMPALIKACAQQDIPIIAEDIALMGSGAVISCAPGPYSDGRELAQLTARILLGASPADIPIVAGKKRELTIDLSALKKAGVQPSVELLKRADIFFNLKAEDAKPAKLVLVNLVDNAALEQAIDGVKAGLAEMGLEEGTDYTLKQFNAQGDMSQVAQILNQVEFEQPDALITVTTPVFVAAAKKNFKFPLIFTVSSDPLELGMFKQGQPPTITGVHDDPPVDRVLEMAKKADLTLSKVAIIYDPAQVNSMISVERLRVAGQQQNIQVLEGTASTVSDLPMVTQAVIQRGARAIIISADNLANTGFSAIHKVAEGAGVPIYTTNVGLVDRGAAGAIGDSYFDWGRQSGHQLARVLAGVSPADLPIHPTTMYQRIEPKVTATQAVANRAEPLQLRCVLYSETEFAERCLEGFLDGIEQAGLVEGDDYKLRVLNAQGDMSTLASIMTSVKSDQVDLLMVVSTPTLQAALRLAGDATPIVFTGVGDGVKAGAGVSEIDHLPNVTGISTRSPFAGMARIIKESLPQARTVGTIFTPGEINSVLYKDWFKQALEQEGLTLETVPVSTSADLAQAADQLCSKNIDVVAQVVDNLTRPGFALIARKAQENDIPTYVFDSDQMKDGGVVCLARDYYDAGLEAAQKAMRVLNGEQPRSIPFNNTRSEKLLINYELAQRYHLSLSTQLRDKAQAYSLVDDAEISSGNGKGKR